MAAAQRWLTGPRRIDVALIDHLLAPLPGAPPAALGVRLAADLRLRQRDVACILFTGGMSRLG
jgi:hypothetical protein